jgi:hypothetical protein
MSEHLVIKEYNNQNLKVIVMSIWKILNFFLKICMGFVFAKNKPLYNTYIPKLTIINKNI